MQCADEDGRHAKTIERREVVPGASSLTTCDELREARNEIKRVPENSRGSARSNYLREVRSVRTDCGVDIFSPSFLYFSIGPAFAVSFSSSHLPSDVNARRATGGKGRGQAKEIILDYFLRSALACDTRREERNERTTRHRTHGTQYDA